MNLNSLSCLAADYVNSHQGNRVSAESAIEPNLAGMKIFEPPIFGVARADDQLFMELKQPQVIGEHFMSPKEWLDGAVSVISFFLPFTEEVRVSNREDMSAPSPKWLHGRYEGQKFVIEVTKYLHERIIEAGYTCVAPLLDSRLKTGKALFPPSEGKPANKFTSNWSERHVAYVCGLGTFGLSRGIITEKGMAGRLGSLISNMPLDVTERKYNEVYEYCTMCGKCIENCPAFAISFENGKIHEPCSDFLDQALITFNPRYGCGKCQVSVPCEFSKPV